MPKWIAQQLACDVLVVGGGLAGCLAALAAKESLGDSAQVVIVDKGRLGRSGQSPFAAGIFTVFDPARDDLDSWMEEIITAGEFLNDQLWCKQVFEQVYPIADKIDCWGQGYGRQVFVKGPDGRFLRRRSRGHIHTEHCLINSLDMMDTLRRKLQEKGVKILDRVMVTDLLLEEGVIRGAVGNNYQEAETYHLAARAVILAASGCGFKAFLMGHHNLTGDLQAAAWEVGAEFTNMEQGHTNTTARDFDIHGLNLYVSVGGKFINSQGEEFMWNYNPTLGNRAQLQDLVLSFCCEVEEGRGPIYFDITSASAEDEALCRSILPESFRLWDRAQVNPFKAKVEWMPGFKGTTASGGGLKVNLACATNIPGLYGAGDINWIGAHGTYSFGGINIAYTAVSGEVAGKSAALFVKDKGHAIQGEEMRYLAQDTCRRRLSPLTRTDGREPGELIFRLQELIIPYRISLMRSAASLAEAQAGLEEFMAEQLPQVRAISPHDLVKAIEVQSMAVVARMMLAAANYREESRGFHHRLDFPWTDNENWLKLVIIKKEGQGLQLRTEAVLTPFVKPREKKSLPPGSPKGQLPYLACRPASARGSA